MSFKTTKPKTFTVNPIAQRMFRAIDQYENDPDFGFMEKFNDKQHEHDEDYRSVWSTNAFSIDDGKFWAVATFTYGHFRHGFNPAGFFLGQKGIDVIRDNAKKADAKKFELLKANKQATPDPESILRFVVLKPVTNDADEPVVVLCYTNNKDAVVTLHDQAVERWKDVFKKHAQFQEHKPVNKPKFFNFVDQETYADADDQDEAGVFVEDEGQDQDQGQDQDEDTNGEQDANSNGNGNGNGDFTVVQRNKQGNANGSGAAKPTYVSALGNTLGTSSALPAPKVKAAASASTYAPAPVAVVKKPAKPKPTPSQLYFFGSKETYAPVEVSVAATLYGSMPLVKQVDDGDNEDNKQVLATYVSFIKSLSAQKTPHAADLACAEAQNLVKVLVKLTTPVSVSAAATATATATSVTSPTSTSS